MKCATRAALMAVLLAYCAAPVAAGAASPPPERSRVEHPSFSLGLIDPDRPAKIREANAGCLSCHSQQGVEKPPRPGLDLAQLARLTISPQALAQSVHAGLACTACHGEAMAEYPHSDAEEAPAKSCIGCHPRAAKYILSDFRESRHYLRHKQSFTCNTCHDPHAMRQAADLGSPRAVAQADNAQCLSCHANQANYARVEATRPMPDLLLHHAWLPSPELHWTSTRCIDCHVVATEAGYSHRFTRIVDATRDCGTCHTLDSALRTRLYRKALYQPAVDSAGFANAYILANAYVIGATRNLWLDQALVAVGGLLAAGLVAHALVRVVTANVRQPRAPAHGVYLFSGWIRVWHWLNALLMLCLAVTGMSLHYAAPRPVGFDVARRLHETCGIALAVAYLCFLVASQVSGNWKQFVPPSADLLRRIGLQARFYVWDIFRGRPQPFSVTQENNFNPLQQIIYFVIMYVAMPVLIASGAIFLFPELLPARLLGIDSLLLIAVAHYVAASAIVFFTMAHVYLVTTGRTVGAHLKSMVTGWHED
jgi:thiosulfate reductase cytochrome b subunit